MKGGEFSEQKVLILYNRPSCSLESELGVLDEVEALKDALKTLGIGSEVAGILSLQEAREALKKSTAEVIFNLVESFDKDVISACLIPDLCKEFCRAVTGSTTPSLIKTTDKVITKGILRAHGMPTPNWRMIGGPSDLNSLGSLKTPFILKPILSDGSEGIYADRSVITPKGSLNSRTKALIRDLLEAFPCGIMAEEYVGDREVNITVIEKEKVPMVLELSEIDFSLLPAGRPKIVDYPAKWQKASLEYRYTQRVIPARLPHWRREQLIRLGLSCFELYGCNDYIRIDVRLDDESFWVIDINTNPDISSEAGLMAALKASRIEFVEFIRVILANAIRRKGDPNLRRDKKLPYRGSSGTNEEAHK